MVVSRQFCFEMCLVWLNHLDGVAGPPMWSIPGNSGFEICLVWLNHIDGAADPRGRFPPILLFKNVWFG